ncbi:unnamed protein product [Moneuplotes crassus]|uniref:Centromere protein J C-terminal domain-containing protein n=1 Tax=Euplotes crassus TaxID=5936 RepID=A0AAD1XPM7_EUPCR|nr:unnamed protein product [Moneuplotes crassus]
MTDASGRMSSATQYATQNSERMGGTASYPRQERMSYMPTDYSRMNTGGSMAYPSSTGFNQASYDTEFKSSTNFQAPTPQQYTAMDMRNNFETSAPASFVPKSKYLSTLTSQNTSKPTNMSTNFQNMSVPQPQSYENKPEPMKYSSPADFTQMPSNSALMQSYNLMKMSSQVTKNQAAAQYAKQQRFNNYFPQNAQQPTPQPQPDMNMGMYGLQRMNTTGGMNLDQKDDNNFLSNISPADMGIPLDAVGMQGSPPRPNPAENRFGSPNRMGSPNQCQNDFPPFDEVFKSKKPAETSGNNQVSSEIPFDEKPVGGGNSQPPMMQQNNSSEPSHNKKGDTFAVDFNYVEQNEPQNDEIPDVSTNNQTKAAQDLPPLDPNVVNVDEIQIKPKQQLTFEELLEKELNDKEKDANPAPPDDDRVIRKPKKEFLKRTSKKTTLPKEKQGGKKYKYYADNFDKKNNSNGNSGSEVEKSECSKSAKQGKCMQDNESKQHESVQENETKTFLSKGAGLGGGKGKTNDDLNDNNAQKSENPEDDDKNPTPDNSGKNRRGRKARGPNTNSIDAHNDKDPKNDSLEEFEVLEGNINNDDNVEDYEEIKKNYHASGRKFKHKKSEAPSDVSKRGGHTNSSVNESGAERQRLAKEKKEFKKQKEKFEAEKLSIEKQKRDLDKQKIEFEKTKETETKKINVERQKLEKEKKAFHRQNDKKKEDSELTENLYREIDALHDELRKKDNKNIKLEDEVKDLHHLAKEYEEKIFYLEEQLKELRSGMKTEMRTEGRNQAQKEKPVQKIESKIPRATKPCEDKSKNEKRNIRNTAQEEVSIGLDDEFKDFDTEEDAENNQNNPENDQQNSDGEGEAPEMDYDDPDNYSLVFLEKYHGEENEKAEIVQESEGTKGKIFRLYSHEKREILFTNGVKKEIFPDGYSIVYFANDDIKQSYPDGRTVYYFADAGTAQTTLPDGLKIYKFNNDQIEKHYTDGTKEIIFPDGTVKYIFGVSDEESIFTDGTIQRLTPDGLKVVEYPSGQKDIVYPDGTKERQYPSGKVKKMNPDGVIKSFKADDN